MTQASEDKIDQALPSDLQADSREPDGTREADADLSGGPTDQGLDSEALGDESPVDAACEARLVPKPAKWKVWMADAAVRYPGPDRWVGDDLVVEMRIEGWSPTGPG